MLKDKLNMNKNKWNKNLSEILALIKKIVMGFLLCYWFFEILHFTPLYVVVVWFILFPLHICYERSNRNEINFGIFSSTILIFCAKKIDPKLKVLYVGYKLKIKNKDDC